MDVELKPCPFCGGEAVMMDHYRIRKPNVYKQFRVGCKVCDLRYPKFRKTPEEAAEVWNNRVSVTTVNQYGKNCSSITNTGTLNISL